MNEYSAYINTTISSCGGTRVFVEPGYDYNASERLILGQQSSAVRDCYWLMAQEQKFDAESLGDRLDHGNHDIFWRYAFDPHRNQILGNGAPARCKPSAPRPWCTAFSAQPYARPTYRM